MCIIDENLPVPADPRVWREAKTLRDAGYQVSIICPKGRGFENRHETLEGIEIYRHPSWDGATPLGYLLEYFWALTVEFALALKVYLRTRFLILQACNPPDTIFLIALFFKLFGVRFVFDHHDLTPEYCAVRFRRKGFFYHLARLAERISFCVADVTIATNSAFREIALTRGGVSPERNFVVRTCPDLQEFPPQPAQLELKDGRNYLVVFVGEMGPQDGVDLLLKSIDYLINVKGRRDTLFALIGSGSELGRLRAQAAAHGLDDCVKFTGRLYGHDLRTYLATATVGVAPDPSNMFNDKLTMIKILEYMAYGVPVVLYDLPQGHESAGEAALYARGNDPIDFAAKISQLLDSGPTRDRMGAIGRKQIVESLNWGIERQELLRAYNAALNGDFPPIMAGGNNSPSSSNPKATGTVEVKNPVKRVS